LRDFDDFDYVVLFVLLTIEMENETHKLSARKSISVSGVLRRLLKIFLGINKGKHGIKFAFKERQNDRDQPWNKNLDFFQFKNTRNRLEMVRLNRPS
jgi:hypothetical protein